MSNVVRIRCWYCHESMTLFERQQADGICPCCGAEVALDDYLTAAIQENLKLEGEAQALRDQVKALQSDANSYQSGYDEGRRMGTKHRQDEVEQLTREVEALRARVAELEAEVEDADGLSKRLGELLSEITIIIRGPEPELTRWGYSDLPLRVKAVVEEVAALRARVVVVPDWKPLTGPGQIKKGDLLRFAVAGKEIEAPAQLIINEGTGKEEIVYNRGKNHYFITSMAVDGTSSHKSVQVKSLNSKVVSEGLLRDLLKSAQKLSDRASNFMVSGVEFIEIGDNNSAVMELEVTLEALRAVLDEGKEDGHEADT